MIIDGSAKSPDRPPSRWVRLAVLLCLAAGLVIVALNRRPNSTPFPKPGDAGFTFAKSDESAEVRRGEALARTLCASCHRFPEPDSLDRFTWGFSALPNMAIWLGLTKFDYEGHAGGKRLQAAHYFPESPALPFDDWRAICSYYLSVAPITQPPQDPKPPVQKMTNQFSAFTTAYRRQVPQTTLVKIDSAAHKIYVGDGNTNTLTVLDPSGKSLAAITLDSPPVSLTVRSNGLYVTCIGSFAPSDDPTGNITLLETPKQGAGTKSSVIGELYRPTDTVFADLDQDGLEDMVVCQYGNFLGRFSWYQNAGGGKYREQVLLEQPGAIKSYVHDFNKDGRPDIVVLMAQAREGVYLFLNGGGGKFTLTPLLEMPPTWGFSSFQLVDFNHDGAVDLLTTNGDNGDIFDYRPPFKRYHGVRLYLNDGRNHFKEAFFYPLNGAYKALAADFKGKGNLDIAAISFFPDYEKSPEESFVYLENSGDGKFTAATLGAGISGRWITMDVGDLDGDGRADIVLGAYNRGPGTIPKMLAEQWEKRGSTLLVLKNTPP
jgi:hypothetical protein